MGAYMRKMPTPRPNPNKPQFGPFTTYKPHPVSYRHFLRSYEVLLYALLTAVGLYMLIALPGSTSVTGDAGLIRLNGRRRYRRLQSRDQERSTGPPAMMYADLTLVMIGGITVLGLVRACGRVVLTQYVMFEAQKSAEANIIDSDPVLKAEKEAQEARELREFDEMNAARVKAGRRKLRRRIVVERVDVEGVTTNVIIVLACVISCLMLSFIMMRHPNQVSGFGTAVMLAVLVGSVTCPRFDPELHLLMRYCNIVQGLLLAGLLGFVLQAVLAND